MDLHEGAKGLHRTTPRSIEGGVVSNAALLG